MSERRAMLKRDHPLPVTQRCRLLEVARSTAYYRPACVSEDDLAVMRLMDEIHLELPFYGSRRLCDELQDRGHPTNRKRVQRLMRVMGLVAVYPRRRTSAPGRGPHRLSVPTTRADGRATRSGLGDGHLLFTDGQGLYVSGRHYGLALASGVVLAGVQYDGYGLLRRGT